MNTSTPNYIVLKELAGNSPTTLDPLQQFFAPYVNEMTAFWIALWCVTFVAVIVHLVREYLKQRKYGK